MLSLIDLHELSRPQLQKLAKENDIKANLKSSTIIELYLQKNEIPCTSHSEAVVGHQRAQTEQTDIVHVPAAPSNSFNADILVNGINQALPRLDTGISVQRPFTPPHGRLGSEDSSCVGTPESSPARSSYTPERADEAAINYVIQLIEEAANGDNQLVDVINTLRQSAKDARKRAHEIRSMLRAEKGSRDRIDAFLRYWRNTKGGWPFEVVWGQQLRIHDDPNSRGRQEVLSSDDEGYIFEDRVVYLRRRPRHPTIPPPTVPDEILKAFHKKLAAYKSDMADYTGPGCTTADPAYRKRKAEEKKAALKEAAAAKRRKKTALEKTAVESKKRYRDETSTEDEERHQPRPRSSNARDKGKRKMTAEEVEQMNGEGESNIRQSVTR